MGLREQLGMPWRGRGEQERGCLEENPNFRGSRSAFSSRKIRGPVKLGATAEPTAVESRGFASGGSTGDT